MENKKGFTLIELIVVIAILGILALFLVPSFMGYAKDAKIQMMKSNVKTGQNAYTYAWTKNEDVKNEIDQKKQIEKEVCENLESTACYFFIGGEPLPTMTEYPRYVFSVGSTLNMEDSMISYYSDKDNYCVYIYGNSAHNKKDAWMCKINGISQGYEEID